MLNLTSALTLANIVLMVAIVACGVFAWRRVYSRTISEIQERVIAAQKSENAAQAETVERLRERVKYLDDVLATVRIALGQRGITMSINGESVTLTDTEKPKQQTLRIRKDQLQQRAAKDDERTH